MKRLQLLFACCCSSILAVTSCIRVDRSSCVTAYRDTITCVMDITGNPTGRSNIPYSLKFIDRYGEDDISCPLVVMNSSYSCACKVKTDSDPQFMDSDEYNIQLCHESSCQLVAKNFIPSENIQLTPPHDVEVQKTPETFNITWKSGYEDHQYFKSDLDYELLLQTSKSTENKTLHPNSCERSVVIQKTQLKPDATFCIKVRSKPHHPDYKGTWSNWSQWTCWKTEAKEEEEDNTLVILIKSLGPVCVAVGVLLFVFYSPAARMKIKTLSHIPSPAPFFQPLFQQHKGDLQEWLSPEGKFVLTYKAEEILTTDAVIVVPKPITKIPEENQDFHNPTVQLAFTQCQTSYVGLPGIHEAPLPLTMVCPGPGDMSYTQLPCSVWGVGIGEVEAVSTPPEDFFNISRVESGCSCDDLTQSPECSVPNSPTDDSPLTCYCNDYCILNKTADGFAPVLVSKGSSLNVPSDSLQESES